MTTVYDRLGLTFHNFGDASILTPGAANTLNILAQYTPPLDEWQKQDLANGNSNPIIRTSYFQNPTSNNVSSMLANTTSIYNNANLINNISLMTIANNLIIELNAFQSHTDNISGVVEVTSNTNPSFDTGSAVGQQIMLILSKTDGTANVTNTEPILGSFTSLFIQNELKSNTEIIYYYSSEFNNSITNMGGGVYTSNLSGDEIANISNYLSNTTTFLSTRRNSDVNYYNNAMKIINDFTTLQQLGNYGTSSNYMIDNIVGTDDFKKKRANTANT